MMLSFSQIRLFLVSVLVVSFFSGCVTVDTQATRFYVLNSLDANVGIIDESDKKGSLSIEVASLRLPQYLERPQIVTRSGENLLELAEYHQWGGNLRKNMMRVLAKNLSQLLDTPNIAISPHRPPAPPDFRVELEVMQFERDSSGHVRLSTQWRLSRGIDMKPLVTQFTDIAGATITAETDFTNTVSSMSTLIGDLSKIIGQEILKHNPAKVNP